MSNQLTLPHFGKWSILSLLAGLLITALTVNEVNKRNEQLIVEALDSIALDAIEQMRGRINLYQYGLTAARGAILMVGSENLKRDLFRTFINSRAVDTEFPGARGFGFIQRVSQADLPDFVAFAQADGWPDYTLKELSPNRAERFMILYIEPVERNVQAVGLDIGSEKHRRAAAQGAIDTGLAQLTSPITLVQASGQSQQSFLFLLPVFAQGVTPVTRAERNALAIGWTYNALLMDEVLADLDLTTDHIHLELFDVTDPNHRVQFYNNDRSATQDLHRRTSTHPMFGRSWEAQFSVQPGFIDALTLTNVGQIAILGLIISLLATGLVMSTQASRRNKQLLIDQQSRLAAIVESSEDAIISNNDQGVITSWTFYVSFFLSFFLVFDVCVSSLCLLLFPRSVFISWLLPLCSVSLVLYFFLLSLSFLLCLFFLFVSLKCFSLFFLFHFIFFTAFSLHVFWLLFVCVSVNQER